jgi:hypothetical protein
MRKLIIALLAVLATASAGLAQERRDYSQAELDQMLAPIALYPDALLSQVLMASTYPLDIVEAARWTRTNPGLQGDEAVNQIAGEDWDPSVKSLVAFPNLLQRMNENLAWTRSLGEAFLDQEPHVMETVQQLRRKAQAAGHLLPDERLRVVDESGVIVIEPAHPQVVYVPYYDPLVVYGAWWWPHYQPVVWAPWPGYYVHRAGFWWGTGIGVTAQFFFGGVDWRHRHVKVVHVNNFFVRPLHGRVIRPLHVGKWQHDSWRRRGERLQVERRGEFRPQAMPPPTFRASNSQPRVEARPERRVERPQPRVEARPERRLERPQPRMEARPERRLERPQPRAEAQRPQTRIAAPRVEARPPQPRIAAPRVEARPPQPRIAAPRVEARPPQPRIAAPRVEARLPQPRVAAPRMEAPRAVQPRMGVQQSQPRMESRPQMMRAEPRGGGNGGGRSGGWRGQGGRGNGRN